MHEHKQTTDADSTVRRKGLKRLLGLATHSAASWNGRHSSEVSSALASAPGVAEEARRQGAPDQVGAAEGSRTQDTTSPPCADSYDAVHDELSKIRDHDAPPLLAPMNRKRTTEKRDQVKSIRFTKTAERLIEEVAAARRKKFAGFVGDAALKEAIGQRTGASPEEDPLRPLVEALETQSAQLRRVGNNLNQIARAVNAGTTPAHADAALTALHQVLGRIHTALDTLLAE